MIGGRIFISFLLCSTAIQAQVPRIGTDAGLEIAAWNVEWFGSPANGPADERLQFTNVKNVIFSSDFDVIGLAEISDTSEFRNLVDELGIYEGTISRYFQTQKTALVWKKNTFDLLEAKPVMAAFSADFANGRLPLEVTLTTKNRLDTLVFLVLHLKANTGTTAQKRTAYFDRQRCAGHIQQYLQLYASRKIVVLGDWNDDLVTSIFNDTITPYRSLLEDTTGQQFILYPNNLAGDRSYAFSNGLIDHILINERMKAQYVRSSAQVFYLTSFVSNYANTTSDHFPVYGRFTYTLPAPSSVQEFSATPGVYPNPSSGSFTISGEGIAQVDLLDMTGRLLWQESYTTPLSVVKMQWEQKGIFLLRVNGKSVSRIIVN